MKLHGADIIQVTEKGEETATEFVIPHFNFVVVTAGNDEGLEEMEINTADWTVMLFESIDYCSHAVIPSID
jgi:hypothetical protein